MPLKDPLAVSTQEPCDRCDGWQVKLPVTAPDDSVDSVDCLDWFRPEDLCRIDP